jgi:bacterioferritin-associated ferredoxin
MHVCSCHDVTTGQIEEAVENGVCSFAELSRKTGLGRECHFCARSGKAIFYEALRRKQSRDGATTQAPDKKEEERETG